MTIRKQNRPITCTDLISFNVTGPFAMNSISVHNSGTNEKLGGDAAKLPMRQFKVDQRERRFG